MFTKTSRLLATIALTALPIATAHARAPNPCGDLPRLLQGVVSATEEARALVQIDYDRYDAAGGYPGAPGLSRAALQTTLDVAARAAPYAAEAAARGTPGGSAWGYQVHMFLVPAGDIGGALSNAASWALISAVYNHSQYTYDAVSVIRRARDLATQLDLEASLCYASGYAPFHN